MYLEHHLVANIYIYIYIVLAIYIRNICVLGLAVMQDGGRRVRC